MIFIDESLTIVQQLVDLVGLGSSGNLAYDIFGMFFFLTVCLLCFNLVFTFIQVFFRRN